MRPPQQPLLLRCADQRPSGRQGREAAAGGTGRRGRHTKALNARSGGFELHAGVRVAARSTAELERLCRHIGRPPLPQERISLRDDGKVLFQLKRAWRGGETALVFEPLAFIARIAALIPPPRSHSRRLYGVFAPAHALRRSVVPKPPDPKRSRRPVAPKRPASMAWADLLRRVFLVDALACCRPGCNGRMRIVAAVFDPPAIQAICAALIDAGDVAAGSRAPPAAESNRTGPGGQMWPNPASSRSAAAHLLVQERPED